MEIQNCIYRFINKDNEIIYIGKAKNLRNRLATHSHLPEMCYEERYKVEFCLFNTEYEMDFAKRYFIPKIKPKYNTVFKDRVMTFDIPELDNISWYEFGEDDFIKFQVYFKEIISTLNNLKVNDMYQLINMLRPIKLSITG